MKKRLLLSVATIAFVGMMAAFASSAMATPSQKSPCSNCHSSDPGVTVSVTQVSNDGTNATYNVSVTNPYGMNGWGVFSGSTKLAGTGASTGTFSVPDSKSYTVFGVSGNGNGTQGYGSTTISPVAPAPVDTTAPVTTSNAVATYVSSAAITLSATDAGSGVAATYYRLDSGAQAAGNLVNVTGLGAHTLEFWSVDVAGNVEAHNTVSFTIAAPLPAPAGTYTVRTRVNGEHSFGRLATLTNTVTGDQYTATIGRHGLATFTDVPAGVYRVSVGARTLSLIRVPASQHDGSGGDDESRQMLED